MDNNKVITGWWGNEPIWRWKTPEERLQEENIKPEVANLFISLTEQ